MTIKQIDAAIAAEHGQTKLSRVYARHLEWLRARTLEVQKLRRAECGRLNPCGGVWRERGCHEADPQSGC